MPLVYLSRYVFQRAELRIAVHSIWEPELSLVRLASQTVPPRARPHTTESRAFCFCPSLIRSSAKTAHSIPALDPPTSERASSTSQRSEVNTLPSQTSPLLFTVLYHQLANAMATTLTCSAGNLSRTQNVHHDDSLLGWDLADNRTGHSCQVGGH